MKFLAYFTCTLFFLVCQGQNLSKIDSIVNANSQFRNFEGVVLIAKNGLPIYHKSFGYANRELKLPMQTATKFGIASITKMITAIVILQLVDEGKLNLESPLSELLPDLAIPKSKKITTHHLLLHISGLPNENDRIYEKPISPKDFAKSVSLGKLNTFGAFNYANIDYVLLGLIVEKVSGTTWEENVKNRVVLPLKLNDTGFLIKGQSPVNLASTYTINEDTSFQRDPDFHIENFFAAGNMYSTAKDLLILDQAMYDEEFLSDKMRRLMFKSYPEYNYTGYSVWTYNYPFSKNKPLIMERRGGILGSNSVLIRFLESNQTIIILSNNDQFNPDSFGNPQNLREALISTLDN
jgi:CubicO group peptidase (beta-lactamase class C family)